MIRYIPLLDEEIDSLTEERITAAIEAVNSLNDTAIPKELLTSLEAAIEEFSWDELIIAEDYDRYEDYVDAYRDNYYED